MNDEEREVSSPLPTEESAGSAPQPEVTTTETPATPEPSENFQKRIDTVIGQRNDVRLENDQLKQQLEAARQVEVKVSDINEPKIDDFDDPEEFTSALINYRVDKGVSTGLNNYVQSQNEASQKIQQDNVVTLYTQRENDFSAQVTDFYEAIGGLNVTPQVRQAIMVSDMGPQVAYAIAKDPGLISQLNQMDTGSAFMKVGEIAQTVRVNGVTNKISSAPDPITPPNGGGGALKSADLNKMSLDEFMANQGVIKTSQ